LEIASAIRPVLEFYDFNTRRKSHAVRIEVPRALTQFGRQTIQTFQKFT
jgi:hypothetical protein